MRSCTVRRQHHDQWNRFDFRQRQPMRFLRSNPASGRQPRNPGELMSYPATSIIRAVRADTSGAAASEFALLAISLVLGLLNAVDMGRYEYQRLQVENAAQAGAQAAWHTCNDPSSMLPATGPRTAGAADCPYGGNPEHHAGRRCCAHLRVSGGARLPLRQLLERVGSSLAVSPANPRIAAAGNWPRPASPGDYIEISVSFSWRHSGVTVVSAWARCPSHHDELDAVGLTMRIARPFSLTSCGTWTFSCGPVAVGRSFLIFMAMVGTLYGGFSCSPLLAWELRGGGRAVLLGPFQPLRHLGGGAKLCAAAVLWREHAHIRCIDHRVRTSSQRYAHCRIQRGGDERELSVAASACFP